jgi:hypothetical protein
MRWTQRRRARTRSQGGSPVSDHRAPDERRQSPAKPFGEDGWLRTAKPCGPGTRCWCQVGGGFSSSTGSRKTFNPPMTVTRRIRRRGERGISRKAIAQGRRNAPTVPVCSCAFLRTILHTRPRVQQAPGVPCALDRAGEFSTARAHCAARTRTHTHAPSLRAKRSNPSRPAKKEWIASRSLSSLRADPVARNDGRRHR